MSGYQIANNVPNFFIPNAQQELVLTQLDFLLNTYQKPAEHVFSAATGTVTLTAQQVLDGLVVLEAGIGGAVAVQLPTAAAIFNELQARVFGQQNITANEIPTAVRTNFFGLTRGFNFQTKIINNAGGVATFSSPDANMKINQVGTLTLQNLDCAAINFVVTAIPTTLLPTQKKVCAILLTGA